MPELARGFDWIVVGAGSGGAVVARRLAERGAGHVLLLEAGPPDTAYPAVADPGAWVSLMGGPLDWGLSYAPQRHALGRVIPIPRGRVLGGSSAINALLWYRGHRTDTEGWGAGWSHAETLPAYLRAEAWEGGADAYRGGDGPIHIETPADPHPIARALLDAAPALGLPLAADPNGADNEGAALAQLTMHEGRRWSVADGYVRPMLDHPAFTLRTNASVLSLIVERGRCTGVRVSLHDTLREIRATRGVVLAAGALHTPQLLMLSGIGPADALRRLGLPVVADLPGVGADLQDHPLLMGMNFRARAPLGPLRDNGGGAMLNWRSRDGLTRPDLHAFIVQGPHAGEAIRAGADFSGPVFAISPGLMDSRSRGWLRLTGPNWGDPMEIQPNYLAEPADLAALVSALDTVMDLAETPAYREIGATPVAPARRLSLPEKQDFVRRALSTFFHCCGTCAIGPVVDSRLAVHGIEGLSIADASVMPDIPTCNTNAPTIMIGERAADFLTAA